MDVSECIEAYTNGILKSIHEKKSIFKLGRKTSTQKQQFDTQILTKAIVKIIKSKGLSEKQMFSEERSACRV